MPTRHLWGEKAAGRTATVEYLDALVSGGDWTQGGSWTNTGTSVLTTEFSDDDVEFHRFYRAKIKLAE